MDKNIVIDIISAFIIAVVLNAECRQPKKRTRDIHIFRLLIVNTLFILLMDIPGAWLDAKQLAGARTWLWIFDTMYWIAISCFGWFWVLFAHFRLIGKPKHYLRTCIMYAIPMLAELVLIFINPFTHGLFSIDAGNRYTVGNAYIWNQLPVLMYVAVALVIIGYGYTKKQRQDQRWRCLLFLILMLLPVCGMVLELFAYGVTWVWPLATLSLLMEFMSVQQQYIFEKRISVEKEKERAARLKRELTDTEINIMLSQIQPHFLYNSLAVIGCLCETKPQIAAEAMRQFTDFIRESMDSLTVDKTISFEQELTHTKNYLALEKLRLEDFISIRYDIQTTLFRVPALSIQPLVENAICHGIREREEGGTIVISSSETDESYIVSIEDDGYGFNETEVFGDDRKHTGISNVRNRLQVMCGGKLSFHSVPNKGTTVIITIPKGGDVG